MSAHVVPLKTYYAIFGALLCGTALTVWVSYLDLGPMNTVVAISIAVVKALLVALYFMHLKFERKSLGIIVASTLILGAILVSVGIGEHVLPRP